MAVARYSRYNQIFDRVMYLWERYSEEYRTIQGKYEDLLAQKMALNIKPIDKISILELELFPEIKFFEIEDMDEAEEYLLELTQRELESLNIDLDLYLDGYILRTLRNRIVDYQYALRRYNTPRQPLAMNPNACSSRTKCRRKILKTRD